jgi:hypothetical protein
VLSPYRKAVVAALISVLYAGLVVWQVQVGDGFQATDLFPLVAAVAAAVLTYVAPVFPEYPHLKTVVAGLAQAVAAIAVLFQNTGTAPNVVAVLIAALGTFAVHKAVNAPSSTSRAPAGEHEAP